MCSNVLVPSSYSPGGLKLNVYKYWETYVADKQKSPNSSQASLVTWRALFHINSISYFWPEHYYTVQVFLCVALITKRPLKHLLVLCCAGPAEPLAVYSNVQAV